MAQPTTSKAVEAKLLEFVSDHVVDPLGYCKLAYAWGKGDLIGSDGPRAWQAEILNTIGRHLRNPETRFSPLKIAVASGRGIGKSGLVGMIAQWGLSTFVDTRIVVTANTDTQLRTKTMPEIAKWFRSAVNSHWFNVTATSVHAAVPKHEPTWRLDAQPWSANSPDAFRGLHNLKRRIIMIFDEASGIDDIIWDTTEGTLTDEGTEIIWLAFSNPSRPDGRFRECFGSRAHRWTTRQIDSRTVEGTNKQFFQEQVEDEGEDSDFVRVHIKGEFPRRGIQQFVPSDIVEAARKREASAHLMDPFVLGVDVGRFGDDESVLVPRRGRDARTLPWTIMRGADTMVVAAKVNELYNIHQFDAVFVDEGGVGGGVVDRLRQLGVPVIGVQFGASADRSVMNTEAAVAYANKRAEMYGSTRDALRTGLAIPDDPQLAEQLTGVQYGYTVKEGRDAILLEKKADMKKRGLSSPDRADALALTYAYPVQPRDHTQQFSGKPANSYEYDPLGRDYVSANPNGQRTMFISDPLANARNRY